MKRYAVKVDAVANADGSLTKDFLSIRECDNSILLTIKTMTESLVYLQIHSGHTRETYKLGIIRIGRNLGNGMNTGLFELLEKTDEPWIGILEATGINEFDALSNTIVVDATIANTLAKGSDKACTIVLNDIIVDKATAMTISSDCIMA